MVRAVLKTKAASKQKPKQTTLSNKSQKKERKNKISPENQSTRITRSKSFSESYSDKKTNKEKLLSRVNTENKENILPLPHLSPRKTRSKSDKIQSIIFDLESNKQQSSTVIETQEQQTKSLVRSHQFVKKVKLKWIQ